MDSFELNKVLGAILGTCLVLLALNIASGAIFAPEKPQKPGFNIAVQEQPEGGKAAPQEQEQPVEALLGSASAERGQNIAKQCQACHTLEKGGPNRVGPNLWNVVGRPKHSEPGFNYSAAMKSQQGNWSYDDLYKFLKSPKAMVPGTAMTFAGLQRDTQRADVIAYLRTLNDNPPPLPKTAAAPAQPAKPQPGNQGAQPNAQPGQAPKKQ
ncbi:MAG TPA: cytochrome c family protein [Pseudolabrys sp.]|nr:cytochrome c family protein [Pseudolabrys sp.]